MWKMFWTCCHDMSRTGAAPVVDSAGRGVPDLPPPLSLNGIMGAQRDAHSAAASCDSSVTLGLKTLPATTVRCRQTECTVAKTESYTVLYPSRRTIGKMRVGAVTRWAHACPRRCIANVWHGGRHHGMVNADK